MSTISNFVMKKNIPIVMKSRKKTIPININSNPTPGKFLIPNQVNQVASSYLSMGQKFQNFKNFKNSKIIHVNTNSASNYYTIAGKDIKNTNNSITSSMMNNYSNINNNYSENNGINFNNYYHNVSQQHQPQRNYIINNSNNNNNNNLDKNNIKYNNVNIKLRRHISMISNSLLPNDIIINGYQTSKNNSNTNNIILNNNINNINVRPKNKIVSKNSKENLSKVKQTYSTRPNFLDSRNKTKKIPMKSKIRQYKYQYKNVKQGSTSISNVYLSKNNIQSSAPRDGYNYVRVDLINNINKENINDNNYIYSKINPNINSNNLYEIKGKHFRHNTASFDNRDIINIFNKKNLLEKNNKNINNLNINNINNNLGFKGNNNNICINNINNINSTKNSNYINQKNLLNKSNDINNEIISQNNISYKISNINHVRRRSGQYSKGKIGDAKIYIRERKNSNKGNTKYNSNTNNNAINSNYIYQNFHSNKGKSYNNHVIHHIKDSRSINTNISEIKKISIKQKDPKKSTLIPNQPRLINKPIPAPGGHKLKEGIIPSQKNIKINLSKYLQEVKTNPSNKVIIGRKSLSIKKLNKENNSDFSLSQLNDKFAQKILKNNDEGNDIKYYIPNISNDKKRINKTIQEEQKEKLKLKNVSDNKININNNINKENENNNNILIDTNYISNIQNKEINKKLPNYSGNNINNNHYKINYKQNSTTTNNNNTNYYGKNKNDYSVDNPSDITNPNNNIINEQIFSINNEEHKIDDLIKKEKDIDNNISDVMYPSLNEKNLTHENILHKILNIEENNLSSEKQKIKTKQININKKELNKEKNSSKPEILKNIKNNTITNNLFDEDNLAELPEDYDENFNDLYSIINKMNFGSVLTCVEGLFTPEGRTYKKFKDKFDKFYEKTYSKKVNSFANSNMKPNKRIEGLSVTSNTKTESSSSKKNVINAKYNDLNIVKDLNVY